MTRLHLGVALDPGLPDAQARRWPHDNLPAHASTIT